MPLVCAHCERPPRKGTKLDGRGYCGNAACRAVSASAAAVASKSQSTLAGFLSPSMRQPTEAGTAKSPPSSSPPHYAPPPSSSKRRSRGKGGTAEEKTKKPKKKAKKANKGEEATKPAAQPSQRAGAYFSLVVVWPSERTVVSSSFLYAKRAYCSWLLSTAGCVLWSLYCTAQPQARERRFNPRCSL